MKSLVYLTMVISWVAGFIIAKGFWSTLFCFFPLWSYYLVVEKIMQFYRVI